MNPEIQLRPHQKNAVARIMYGGNAPVSYTHLDVYKRQPGGEYKATYTPNDIDNYTTVELTLNVEIKKYTPIIGVDIQLPTASDITYGQKLGDSVLTPSENDVIDGEWLWEESDVTPSDDDNSYRCV